MDRLYSYKKYKTDFTNGVSNYRGNFPKKDGITINDVLKKAIESCYFIENDFKYCIIVETKANPNRISEGERGSYYIKKVNISLVEAENQLEENKELKKYKSRKTRIYKIPLKIEEYIKNYINKNNLEGVISEKFKKTIEYITKKSKEYYEYIKEELNHLETNDMNVKSLPLLEKNIKNNFHEQLDLLEKLEIYNVLITLLEKDKINIIESIYNYIQNKVN